MAMVLDAQWKNGAAFCPGEGCRERLARLENRYAVLPEGYHEHGDAFRWHSPAPFRPPRGREIAAQIGHGAVIGGEYRRRWNGVSGVRDPITMQCRRCGGYARVDPNAGAVGD